MILFLIIDNLAVLIILIFVMEGIQTTLYPRYLPQNIPRPNLSVTVVGLVIDVRENKCLSL